MEAEGCQLCQELLDHASSEILRHIRAVGRLDLALANGETDLIPALEIAVKEASLGRENAVARYRHHQGFHRANQAGVSA
jgi:hypothetical protein